VVDSYLYIYGGFEHDSPNVPTDVITRVNILKSFQNFDSLYHKTQMLLASTTEKSKSANVSPDNSIDIIKNGSNSPHSHSANTSYELYKNQSGQSTANTSYSATLGKQNTLGGGNNFQ